MPPEDCLPAARAAGKGLDDAQLREILAETEARMRRRIDAGEDFFGASRAAGMELAAETRLAAMIERRNAGINFMRRKALNARVRPGHEADVLRETLTGQEGANRDAARSIDAERHGLMARLIGPMVSELRQEGLLKPLKRRVAEFDRDVARELWRVTDPEGAPSTGNPWFRAAISRAGNEPT